MNQNIQIVGFGAFLPNQIVKSGELMHEAKSEEFGIRESFLEKASGIVERRFSNDKESFSYLAGEASKQAILDAGIHPLDIDEIFFCGIDRDKPEPSTAHDIQEITGAWNARCQDISNACIGMINGLQNAMAYIKAGMAENILICTGEKPSIVTLDIIRQLKHTQSKANFKKLKSAQSKANFRKLLGALTVGDAGGAFIVSGTTDGSGCQYIKFKSNSRHKDLCYYRHTSDGIEFEMKMEDISDAMVNMHAEMIDETYQSVGWAPDDIGKVFCHQVGMRPHRKMAQLSRTTTERVPKTYNNFGNLTSATFAVNMYLNRPKKGEKVLLLGAGSGLTICQAAFQF